MGCTGTRGTKAPATTNQNWFLRLSLIQQLGVLSGSGKTWYLEGEIFKKVRRMGSVLIVVVFFVVACFLFYLNQQHNVRRHHGLHLKEKAVWDCWTVRTHVLPLTGINFEGLDAHKAVEHFLNPSHKWYGSEHVALVSLLKTLYNREGEQPGFKWSAAQPPNDPWCYKYLAVLKTISWPALLSTMQRDFIT